MAFVSEGFFPLLFLFRLLTKETEAEEILFPSAPYNL